MFNYLRNFGAAIHAILTFARDPAFIDPKPSLWRYENPHASIWRGSDPVIERIEQYESIARGLTPLFFFHGMEYRDADEVIEDLIKPFEREAELFKDSEKSNYCVYFVSWNSMLFGSHCHDHPIWHAARQISMPIALLTCIRHVGKVLKSLEIRAQIVAKYLEPFFFSLLTDTAHRSPIVISHSLGSYVWLVLVKILAAKIPAGFNPGEWFSLQPAVQHDAFCTGREFSSVADVYRNSGCHLEVWYSRCDLILSSLYLIGKGAFAMGQIGATDSQIRQVDVTWSAVDAHGISRLTSNPKGFMPRVGGIIRKTFKKRIFYGRPALHV